METDSGSTAKRRFEPGMSNPTRLVMRSAGGGAAASSCQSGSEGPGWAKAAHAAQAAAHPASSRRMLVLGLLVGGGGLWVRLEGGAGRQLEGRAVHRLVGMGMVIGAVVIAG